MTNAANRIAIILIITMLILSGCTNRQTLGSPAEPLDQPESVFSRAGTLRDQGAYGESARVYQHFIEQYPEHAYVDDAAYRIAYLHVTADPENPLLDYEKARVLFQNFIETYENSRYISACTNWLAVLQPGIGQDAPVTSETADIVQLKQQISELKSENLKLRTTLAELQQAIER